MLKPPVDEETSLLHPRWNHKPNLNMLPAWARHPTSTEGFQPDLEAAGLLVADGWDLVHDGTDLSEALVALLGIHIYYTPLVMEHMCSMNGRLSRNTRRFAPKSSKCPCHLLVRWATLQSLQQFSLYVNLDVIVRVEGGLGYATSAAHPQCPALKIVFSSHGVLLNRQGCWVLSVVESWMVGCQLLLHFAPP